MARLVPQLIESQVLSVAIHYNEYGKQEFQSLAQSCREGAIHHISFNFASLTSLAPSILIELGKA